MAFEKYPIHVRRKIALGITFGLAVVLVGLMIFIYTLPKSNKSPDTAVTKFGQFYATILSDTQSYFQSKRAIISK